MGVIQLTVSTMLGEFRQQQQTGSLGWRIGVALTTKHGKTLVFTKSCHNIDMLKPPGCIESTAIVTSEGEKTKDGRTWWYVKEVLQYKSIHEPRLIVLPPGLNKVTPLIPLSFLMFIMLAKLQHAFEDFI